MPRHRFLLFALALAALLGVGSTPAAGHRTDHVTAKLRAAQRRALLHEIRRDPRTVLRPWFIRRASFLGVDLPVRFRLSPAIDAAGTPAAPDDAVSFALGTDPVAAPLPPGLAAGTVTSALSGSFAGSLRFSQDNSGFGTPGTVELGFGAMALSASSIDMVDDAAPGSCGDPTLVRTDGPIALTAAPGSTGEVGLLGGTFSLDLHLSAALRTETRTACSDPFTTTGLMDGIGRPPLPLRIDGSFRISPALTADGRLRLGRMVLSGPQHDSHVELHSCTAPTPDPCALAGDGTLSGALSASAFSAELLVGSGA